MKLSLLLLLAFSRCSLESNPIIFSITEHQLPTSSGLRGLAVVNDTVAWVCGGNDAFKTTDGEHWTALHVDDTDTLEMRDIEAFNDRSAVVLSVTGPAQIFKTRNGGITWSLRYEAQREDIFLDAMDFWDEAHGMVFGDAINGHLFLLITSDGGASWQPVDPDSIPESPPGEGGFAASGTCLFAGEDNQHVWIGLGGPFARVIFSDNSGKSWKTAPSPLQGHSSTQGIYSLAFKTLNYGLAVGGDYMHPEDTSANITYTLDGGYSWERVNGSPPKGYRSSVVNIAGTSYWVCTGPTGTDFSSDDGMSWQPLDSLGYHAIGFSGKKGGWMSGSKGRLARISTNQTHH